MAYWAFTLRDESDNLVDEHQITISDEHHMIWLEGTEGDVSSWIFSEYDEYTQPRREWLGQIVSEKAALTLSVELDEVYIRQVPPDPVWADECTVKMDYTTEQKAFVYSIRNGDVIEFRDRSAKLAVKYYPCLLVPPMHTRIEVASSRPDQGLGDEQGDHDGSETEDDDLNVVDAAPAPAHDESQLIYSTSREHLSATPKPQITHESQIVEETPAKKQQYQAHPALRSDQSSELPQSSVVPMGNEIMQSSETGEFSHPQTIEETQQIPDPAVLASEAPVVRRANSPSQPLTMGNKLSPVAVPSLDDVPNLDVVPNLELKSATDESPNGPQTHGDVVQQEQAMETPQSRGTKRKVKDASETASRTSSSKRTKTTTKDVDEAKEMSVLSSVSRSTPRQPDTQRRYSPRVVRSQASASPDPPPQTSSYHGESPRILFSSESELPQRKGLMRFLADQKAKQTEDVKTANFFCVKKSHELKSTAKVLHSLLTSKHIVTEDWVVQSSKANLLLDPEDFLPATLQGTMDRDRTSLFTEHIIYVSPKLRTDYKKAWDDMHSILREAGAKEIIIKPAKQVKDSDGISLFLGSETGDPNAAELQGKGHQFYKKDVISASIIQGILLLEDEYFLPSSQPSNAVSGKPKKGKTN